MIYQVKGISGYVWGECGCARVCADVGGCVWVCAGMQGGAGVQVVHGCESRCAWVWAEMGGRGAQVWGGGCSGVHGCVHVCGMNFQIFFWRIVSLHILYKFFLLFSLKIIR